ncbi:MAG: 16S rRNA (guanine(966)-N(2))-methyltransferase RsmD [Pseudomonadales bacterium]|jgi:16S rRNA (guanine966-N2)-methyltransferase|nr:16S rRNA (guanine(966)-N(2))-methyltransferase RsmD [Pseudomonadales bacterium]
MARSSAPRKRSSTAKGGQLRIIGGRWRSRKIEFPAGDGLRPTGDRIRETLFNWLQHEIVGASCLDLFAGSGILGLEALSRGAECCTFIDSYEPAYRSLTQQLLKLEVDPSNAAVIRSDALGWLRASQAPKHYDLVFVDPPFLLDITTQCIELLETSSVLADDALIYLEAGRTQTDTAVPANWQQVRHKSSGQVRYCLYRRTVPH